MFTTLQPRIQRTQRNDKNMIKNLETPWDLCEMIAALLINSRVFLLAKEKGKRKKEKGNLKKRIKRSFFRNSIWKKMKMNFGTVKTVIKVIKNYIFDFRIFGVWVGTFGLFSNRWFFYG